MTEETEREHLERLHDALTAEIATQISELKAEINSLKGLLESASEFVASKSSKSSKGRALPEAICRKEDGEFVWDVPEDAPKGKCKYCQLEILWVRSRKGHPCPIDPDGKSHRDTCPERQDEKDEGESPKSESSDVINVPF